MSARTEPAARKARKKAWRQHMSQKDRRSQSASAAPATGSEEGSEAKHGLEVAVGKALKKGSGAVDLNINRFAALTIAPAPATATAASPVTPPGQTPTETPKTPQAPKPNQNQNQNQIRRDIVLAPPQSAFTFKCAVPASMTALPRTAATRNLTRLNAAKSIHEGKTGVSIQVVAFDKLYPVTLPWIEAATSLPTSTQSPLPADVGLRSPPLTPPGAVNYSKKPSDTPSLIPVPATGKPNATGWPEITPMVKEPATRDGKSRFFPPVSAHNVADGSKESTVVLLDAFSSSGVSDYQQSRTQHVGTDANIKTEDNGLPWKTGRSDTLSASGIYDLQRLHACQAATAAEFKAQTDLLTWATQTATYVFTRTNTKTEDNVLPWKLCTDTHAVTDTNTKAKDNVLPWTPWTGPDLCETARVVAQGSRGRDMGKGYENTSESECPYPSHLARVCFSPVGGSSLNVSPSSESEWEGSDSSFWA